MGKSNQTAKIGDMIVYTPRADNFALSDKQSHPALVLDVSKDGKVNLKVFTENGDHILKGVEI